MPSASSTSGATNVGSPPDSTRPSTSEACELRWHTTRAPRAPGASARAAGRRARRGGRARGPGGGAPAGAPPPGAGGGAGAGAARPLRRGGGGGPGPTAPYFDAVVAYGLRGPARFHVP